MKTILSGDLSEEPFRDPRLVNVCQIIGTISLIIGWLMMLFFFLALNNSGRGGTGSFIAAIFTVMLSSPFWFVSAQVIKSLAQIAHNTAKILIISVALAACLTSAQARIGETEAELAQRYGKPVRMIKTASGDEAAQVYRFHGFEITVTIDDAGQCQAEWYKKLDGAALEASEILALAKANAGNQPCSKTENLTETVGFMCGDIYVGYNLEKRSLAIARRSGVKRLNARLDGIAEKDRQAKLKGF